MVNPSSGLILSDRGWNPDLKRFERHRIDITRFKMKVSYEVLESQNTSRFLSLTMIPSEQLGQHSKDDVHVDMWQNTKPCAPFWWYHLQSIQHMSLLCLWNTVMKPFPIDSGTSEFSKPCMSFCSPRHWISTPNRPLTYVRTEQRHQRWALSLSVSVLDNLHTILQVQRLFLSCV